MTLSLLILAATAAPPGAAHAPPPPPPADRPSIQDITGRAGEPPAIFTYTVDGRCGITDTRKLQGADHVRWQDAAAAHDLTSEETVFRFIDGRRTRLRERRVRLLGELVETGELVCQLRPSGEVVVAWIERRDTSVARRQAPRRDGVAVRQGRIDDIGTFSLTLEGTD